MSVTADRTRQLRDSRAVACADRARESPFDIDDDARKERQIEHETGIAITNFGSYDDLLEHCAGNAQFAAELHNIFTAFCELQNKPHSLHENRRLHKEVWDGVEGLVDAWADVARIRVGEHVEKGESYIYRESGDE
tara:strand:+ start:7629 stop:8036 length:408 start_codon:yes stop_codon:yes gene_type:complete